VETAALSKALCCEIIPSHDSHAHLSSRSLDMDHSTRVASSDISSYIHTHTPCNRVYHTSTAPPLDHHADDRSVCNHLLSVAVLLEVVDLQAAFVAIIYLLSIYES